MSRKNTCSGERTHIPVSLAGPRHFPSSWAPHVAAVFVGRGWGIGSGSARGADQFALEAAVAWGRSVVVSPRAHFAAPEYERSAMSPPAAPERRRTWRFILPVGVKGSASKLVIISGRRVQV